MAEPNFSKCFNSGRYDIAVPFSQKILKELPQERFFKKGLLYPWVYLHCTSKIKKHIREF